MQIEKGSASHTGKQCQANQRGQSLIRFLIQSLQKLSGLFRCQVFRHLVVNRRHGNMQCAGKRLHIALAQGKIQQAFDQRQDMLDCLRGFSGLFQTGTQSVNVVNSQLRDALFTQCRGNVQRITDAIILDGAVGALGFCKKGPNPVKGVPGFLSLSRGTGGGSFFAVGGILAFNA